MDDPAGSSLVELLHCSGCFVGPLAGLGGAPDPPEPDATAEWTGTAAALADLRSTHWEDIRRERFSATPKGVYRELQRSVVSWEPHTTDCAERRERRFLLGEEHLKSHGCEPSPS